MIRFMAKAVLVTGSVIVAASGVLPYNRVHVDASGLFLSAAIESEGTPAPEQQPVITSIQVSERIWMFSGRGGNIGVIITDDGVVVIDTQYEDTAPAIVEQIGTLTDQPIRYIINTHIHGDHVGGNAYMQQYGAIIAHQNTYDRMLARWEGEGAPGRGDGFPQLTFRDSFTLNIGGIEIQLFHLGRGHTDTDVVVWVPGENVIHVGDLLFNRMTPYVDVSNGAHTGTWISVINQVIQKINSDTRVIPGHGELSDVDGFRTMASYFQAVRRIVQTAHSEGKTKEEILSLTLADLGEQFADWSGNRLSMALSAAYTEIVGNGPALNARLRTISTGREPDGMALAIYKQE